MSKYPEESSLKELVSGVVVEREGKIHSCTVCGKRFVRGIIYPDGDLLMDAERAALTHVEREHGGMFSELISLGKGENGISDVQKIVLEALYEGGSDRDIALRLGGKSESTVRNHRFNLKRKRKEAKIFLALMDLIDQRELSRNDDESYLQFHDDIPVKDDRISVSTKEAEKIITKYFDKEDPRVLLSFPKKQKIKLVILQQIIEAFEREKVYTELEVNEILMPVYEDYLQIRRYLIDYAFLKRNSDGSEYRRNS